MACILLRLQCCITTSSQDQRNRYYIGPDLLRMRSCVPPFATQVGSRETREFCETGASWEEPLPTTHRLTFSFEQGTNMVAKVRHMEHMSSTYVHCEHVTRLLVLCRVPASCEVSHVNTAAGRHYSLLLKPQDLTLEHCTDVTGVTYVRTALLRLPGTCMLVRSCYKIQSTILLQGDKHMYACLNKLCKALYTCSGDTSRKRKSLLVL